MKPSPILRHIPRPSLGAIRAVRSSPTTKASAAPTPPSRGAPATTYEPSLARLPLSDLLRTLCMTSVTSSPILLSACFSILSHILRSGSAITDINRNPALRALLRHTFYKQYCTGATREEIGHTVNHLRRIGYSGIILEYALEVLQGQPANGEATQPIQKWREGMLQTVDMTEPEDFVGLKWSGLGPQALDLLKNNHPPSPAMYGAMKEVCDLAASKGVSLLPGAEESVINRGLQAWSLQMQKEYNRNALRRPVVYCTYQAYLKSAPADIAKALAIARKEDFTLGLKLVRGAYLSSEPAHLMHESKQKTDLAYDVLAENLLRKQYIDILQPLHGASNNFPNLHLVLATHNDTSLKRAQTVRNEQMARGEALVPAVYAQLQGMADELSCGLLQAAGAGECASEKARPPTSVPQVYKCSVWGPMEDCLNFLLRRVEENKDAATRTIGTRQAMITELWRRAKAVARLA